MKINILNSKDDIEIAEVYKVQVSLFSNAKSVLIYNEDRTQIYETSTKPEVNEIRNFIGKDTVKCYVAGRQNSRGQIEMFTVIPTLLSQEYNW